MNTILKISFLLLYIKVFPQNYTISSILNADENKHWSSDLYMSALSNDASWSIITEVYPNEDKSTFLGSHLTKEVLPIEGRDFKFSSNNKWLTFIDSNSRLVILDLATKSKRFIPNINNYHLTSDDNYLIADSKKMDNHIDLVIYNIRKNTSRNITNLDDYEINPSKNIILVSKNDNDKNQLFYLNYDDSNFELKTIFETDKCNFKNFKWNKSGSHFILFTQIYDKTNTYLFDLDANSKKISEELINRKFPQYKVNTNYIDISDDGKLVVLSFIKNNIEKINHNIEKWNSDDYLIGPKMNSYQNTEGNLAWASWQPYENRLFTLTENSLPNIKVDANTSNALLYNKMQFKPTFMENEIADLYIKNLYSGQKQLICEKQYLDEKYISISNSGNFIAYFKNKNWWIYDAEKNLTLNLTEHLNVDFFDQEDWQKKEYKKPFGSPGWTDDEKYIFIYDKYDIWLISTNGKIKFKISNGSEEKITYRFNWESRRNNQYLINKLSKYIKPTYKNNEPIILDMIGENLNTGFAVLENYKTVKKLFYSESNKTQLLYNPQANKMAFINKKYNLPPALHLIDNDFNNIPFEIYQTNQNLIKSGLGEYKNLTFKNKLGDEMKASLLFPPNYNPVKKYPMITFIYEKNRIYLNHFTPPTLYSPTGFNLTNYLLDGYFILLPDIKYEHGNPGKSALDCVISAVDEVSKYGFIDKERIGLIGHSFGGYEAAFIATQTKKFKTVVAGAAVTDLVSFYHDIAWVWHSDQMWRFESQQFRMGDSYYNMKNKYKENSPLQHIENLETPILLWTGRNDYNINWYQSIFMYTAMRRLNKPGSLLIFNDQHSLTNLENQRNLSIEISNWFNKYLKF